MNLTQQCKIGSEEQAQGLGWEFPCKGLGIKVRWASLGFVGPKRSDAGLAISVRPSAFGALWRDRLADDALSGGIRDEPGRMDGRRHDSRFGIRHGAGQSASDGYRRLSWSSAAGCQPAIQQVDNLRYSTASQLRLAYGHHYVVSYKFNEAVATMKTHNLP
jgi:hypothetical protein